jgi:hypothetical protein
VRSISLDSVHKIGDKIGTTLILVLDIAPRIAHILIGLYKAIITCYAPNEEQNDNHESYDC